MRALSHPGTSVVIDDLTPWFWWGEGPTKAWTEAISQGVIAPVEIFKDGQLVDDIEPPGERSWGLGRYCFNCCQLMGDDAARDPVPHRSC
jgi:hypothetical protein